MIETLILAGGAVYVGLTAYRAARKKAKRPPRCKIYVQSPPPVTALPPPSTPDANLGVATFALGLATAGALAYPLLSLATIPPLLYLTTPNLSAAWQVFSRERRISPALPATLVPLICLWHGYYALPALGFCLRGWEQRLLRRAEVAAREKLGKSFVHTVPPAERRRAEPVIVAAGELIPVDGVISAGSALISSPQRKLMGDAHWQQIGNSVFAASLVQAGCIQIQVQKAAGQTVVAQLRQQLLQAADTTVITQPVNPTDDLPQVSGAPLLALGAAAALLLQPMTAVALLNSKFGQEDGSWRRLVLLNFLGLAAEAGILIKAGRALPQLTQVDTLVLSAAASRQPEAATVIKALRPHISAIYVLTTTTQPLSQRRLHELHADGALVADTAAMQATVLTQLAQAGKCVCYVGDGVTDLPAMQAAFMTISLHYSQESVGDQAQILLLRGRLYPLVTLWALVAEFERTQASAWQTTFAAGALNLASVLFLGSGLLTSLLLNSAGTLASMAQVMLPVVENEPQQLGAWLRHDLWQPSEVVASET